MPKRQLSFAKNQSVSGFNLRESAAQIHGRILRPQSNHDARIQQSKDLFHNQKRYLLLQGHALWAKKRWSDLPCEQDFQGVDRQDNGSLL